ncbi:MAG TPA: FtsW/RodA/SpoVE family cell cycle protein, partial [Mobilitalea sp.]|nr:FtsW/RodA/SpoVE family cell cycle protein [Mobilitalea sp.]
TQSLFAIGTGGWFGMGLNRGRPTDIPVVESDFIFSAISEELGGLFAICIILIYASCFVMFINMALELEDQFYRLVSIGFSVMFVFQVILSIGGVIKFIPSTGVTLPLVSQGGSSVFTTIVMFMLLQGVYMRDKALKKEAENAAEYAAVNTAVDMEGR